jgi:hypothetical protein
MRSHQDLTFAVHAAWAKLRAHLAGLTDDEYGWAPAPNARTVGGVLVHVAGTKELGWDYAYGPAQLTWDHVRAPETAVDALTWLERGQELVESALRSETNLRRPVLTSTGATWPAWRVFWTLAEHDLEHGGEIAVLRRLREARP